MKLPELCICGGVGSLRALSWLPSIQNSSPVTGTHTGGGLLRQSGSSASSGPGSITAPDRICAPTVEAFSITHTDSSGLSCLRRIANASPAGPAPTVMTSYSIVSRSLMSGSVKAGKAGRRAAGMADAPRKGRLSAFAGRAANACVGHRFARSWGNRTRPWSDPA